MSEPPPAELLHQSEWLKRIFMKLDDLSVLSRIQLISEDYVFEFLYRDEKIRFFLPYCSFDAIQRFIISRNTFFEMGLLERFRSLVPRGATIIDCGANIGNHSIYFSVICGAKIVYSYEPLRESFRILQRNIELNAPDRIKCFNIALGEKEGKAHLLKFNPGNIGASRLQPNSLGTYPVCPLDDFDFAELTAIKIDVEGAQISVLEGARATLARHKPLIWIELLANELEESHEKLLSLGYDRVETLSNTDFIYRARGT